MNIPPLAPDITFELMTGATADFEFAFQVKKQAMGPHIKVKWGWDEELQRQMHNDRYIAKNLFAIAQNGTRIGTLNFQREDTYFRIGEFYIQPDLQGAGIGSRILEHCIAFADAEGLPMRLEYLHWNPVGRLYRRYGFTDIGETETHKFLERKPATDIAQR